MPRRFTGQILKRGEGKKKSVYAARLRYKDEQGNVKEKFKRVSTVNEAKDWLRDEIQKLNEHGPRIFDAERMCFNDLADHFAEHYLQPAQYRNGRKVAGRRSLKGLNAQLQAARDFFGSKLIRSVTYGDLVAYRKARLETPTWRGQERTIATVNIELALLRRMLNVAVAEGWITRNPFNAGPSLIDRANEVRRERLLSRNEETRLLAASAPHLRSLLIMLLDTGVRFGEAIQLCWRDVDLANRTITIQSANTKTLRSRVVPITARLLAELEVMFEQAQSGDDLVFGITSNVKRSFATACRIAGIEGFRLHDCRGTFISRLLQKGMAIAEVIRLSGHTTLAALNHYVRTDESTIERAATLLNAFHAAVQEEAEAESKLIN